MKTADQISLKEAIYIVESNKRSMKIEQRYREFRIEASKKRKIYSQQAMNRRRILSKLDE